MRMKDKVALVTGAASGMGAATARLFAREGAKAVYVADMLDKEGAAVVAGIEKAGGKAVFVHLDVTDEGQWKATVDKVMSVPLKMEYFDGGGKKLKTQVRDGYKKDEGRDFAQTAAMAKLFSGELSHRAANWALQLHGGYGFMDEYAISRLYRDQKILEIGEGTNEVQRMVIARQLGI